MIVFKPFSEEVSVFQESRLPIPAFPAGYAALIHAFGLLDGNGGRFSKRAREKEFAGLTDDEVSSLEAVYSEIFEG